MSDFSQWMITDLLVCQWKMIEWGGSDDSRMEGREMVCQSTTIPEDFFVSCFNVY